MKVEVRSRKGGCRKCEVRGRKLEVRSNKEGERVEDKERGNK